MTLPPPPIWPPRSAEEYGRDSSPPRIFVALGVLVMFALTLVAIGYFMRHDPAKGFGMIVVVVALLCIILHFGSKRERGPRPDRIDGT